jgi:hypothetical protein
MINKTVISRIMISEQTTLLTYFFLKTSICNEASVSIHRHDMQKFSQFSTSFHFHFFRVIFITLLITHRFMNLIEIAHHDQQQNRFIIIHT